VYVKLVSSGSSNREKSSLYDEKIDHKKLLDVDKIQFFNIFTGNNFFFVYAQTSIGEVNFY
jgi:hypothetical protein